MGELRRDPIVGRWVIVEDDATSLGPGDYDESDQGFYQQAVCQFCPGKESQTPPEVDAIRLNGSTPPNSPGWAARVVPNKFPALRIEGELDKRGLGIYDLSNGVGAHEVVIENPDHRRNFADYTQEEMVRVLTLYQNRSISLAKDKRFKYIIIFRNFGEGAGASVEHGHSQIIALPMVPKYVQEELEGCDTFFKAHSRCVYCEVIQQEYEDRDRIITENAKFIAFCPFVPKYPFECWIMPKSHDLEFCDMGDEDRRSLADVFKDVMQRIKLTLKNPHYNFYLHVKPVNYAGTYHWHIEIIPKLTREAGFEWGTGFYVVRTSPAMAAKHLRAVAVEQPAVRP